VAYRKTYSLSECYTLVEERFPQYLVLDPVFGTRLCEVPREDVRHHLAPIAFLDALRRRNQLDRLEHSALLFTEFLLDHTDVDSNKLGISGSILAKLHTAGSDIDPIVYGEKNCRQVHESLKRLTASGRTEAQPYTHRELRALYNFRSRDTNTPLTDFIATERRKVLQGKFRGHDFFIRCIKDSDELRESYGDVIYQTVGYGKITAVVSRADESIFTPCRYVVDEVRFLEGRCDRDVTEIASFRGRFCEQARTGETVVAQGKIEECSPQIGEKSFRLLLGERPSDFMLLPGQTK
jgi:predicted nucleotidyltransferase